MFNKYLPVLDLHGEISQTIDLLVKDFIFENYVLGKRRVIIVHGVGRGILKTAVHKSLSENKLILTYKLDVFNGGTTIVEIKD